MTKRVGYRQTRNISFSVVHAQYHPQTGYLRALVRTARARYDSAFTARLVVSEMKVTVVYDEAHDVFTIECKDVHLRTPQDVSKWSKQLEEELEALGGKKCDLFVDMDGFSIAPGVMELYGLQAKRVGTLYATSLIRYNAMNTQTRAEVLLQAVVHRFPANIFPNREAALEALAKIRQTEATGAPKTEL